MNLIKKNLKHHNSLRLSSEAELFFEYENSNELKKLNSYCKKNKLKICALGEGTNTIFPRNFKDVVAKSKNKKFKVDKNTVKIGAGVNWNEAVFKTIKNGCFGLENLAGIPGSVGAAPIQNIGAYGSEISEFVKKLECFDIKKNKVVNFLNEDCKFGYRKSVFQSDKDLIINEVTLILNQKFSPNSSYFSPGIFSVKEDSNDIEYAMNWANKIVELRESKIPNTSDYPNVGSFFKNPLVSEKFFKNNKKLEKLKIFKREGDQIKLSAAEMIDRSDLKGMRLNNLGISSKHSLVFVNFGITTSREVKELENRVIDVIEATYGIKLEREPIYL